MSHIACISYGKDSLKMLDVIKTRGLPLDRIITVDVWATDTIPAEFPEVTAFKKRMDVYIKEKYGIEVEHLYAKYPDGSKITYEKQFYTIYQKGKHKGLIYSFPMQRGAWCNSKLKMNARKGAIQPGDIEYIGIAYDEKKRHKLRHLRSKYPEYWELLLKWDADSHVTFHSDGRSVHDYDRRFEQEDLGIVPKDRTFRWSMLDDDRQMKLIGFE